MDYKYKVGDKVIVRNDLECGFRYGGIIVTEDMIKFRGKIVTINYSCPNLHGSMEYLTEECPWYFTDAMFEGLAPKYKEGDEVIIKCDLIPGNYLGADMVFEDIKFLCGSKVKIMFVVNKKDELPKYVINETQYYIHEDMIAGLAEMEVTDDNQSKLKFKIGDKVRITELYYTLQKNTKVTIVDINPKREIHCPYHILFVDQHNDCNIWVPEDILEKIEDEICKEPIIDTDFLI